MEGISATGENYLRRNEVVLISYTALYREWRPQGFDQVVGQQHVVRTLTNAIRDDQLSHAYLFAGPRGTGKTSVARILAKAINCQQGPTAEPCGECPSCKGIMDGSAMDVIEIDAASNRGINEIRDLREKVRYAPAHSRHKVYIIDEVHMLTTEAFNALLKTLEDPPGHVFFVMATTEAHKIPLTILSRVQRFDFHRIKVADIAARLREIADHQGLDVEESTLHMMARQADGAMRDAVGLLDQCRSFAGNRITVDDVTEVLGTVGYDVLMDLASRLDRGDVSGCLGMVDAADSEGRDMAVMTRDLLGHFRNLMLLSLGNEALLDVGQDHLEGLRSQAAEIPRARIVSVIDQLAEAESRMRYNPQPRLLLEVVLMKSALSGQAGIAPRPDGRDPVADDPSSSDTPVPVGSEQPSGEQVAGGGQEQACNPAPVPAQEDERLWCSFCGRVKSVRRGLHALLEPASLVEVDGDAFVVGFPEQYSFHRARTEESRELLGRILSDLAGRPCRIVCVALPTDAGAVTAPAEARHQASSPPQESQPGGGNDSSQVQELLDVFGGEVAGDSEVGGVFR